MPIFEYKCNDCGQVCEFLEKGKEPQKHKCSKCGGSNLQKMLSGFAVGQSKSGSSCDTCPGPSQAECCGQCNCSMD
jgi:putative FmdB family regulatory protein